MATRNGATGCSPRTRRASISPRASRPESTSSTPPTSIRVGVSEQITGRWLGEMAKRDEMVVATKVHGPMALGAQSRGPQPQAYYRSMRASLRRLKMDYIDLYQIHRWDFTTPIEETLEALDSLVRAGKVRYLGASIMAAWQFRQGARNRGRKRMASVRLDAEPLQPGLSRGRARDESAMHRQGRRPDSMEPARARIPGRQSRQGRQRSDRARQAGRLRQEHVFPRVRFRSAERGRARSPRSAASRRRRSRARGSCRRLASPRRSSARPSSRI